MRPLHPLSALNRLRGTYWFLPALLTMTAIGLGLLLTALDRMNDGTPWFGWVYGGGADGARALLSAVAGSMITVVSVTFSVTVVALTVSSQHFGPRLLRTFMRDQPAQMVLGTFTGTFAYCLIVLRTVQADGGDRFSLFVPHLAVAGAVVLALIAVGVLIYYVHHVALSMQVSEITRRIVHELERSIDELYPEPIGEGAEPPARAPLPVPPQAVWLCAADSGYVQQIDSASVLGLAARFQCTIWLAARPGDFVVSGDTIAAVHPAPEDPHQLQRSLASAYLLGSDRTHDQDAAFGVQQLVEIALRALSPGTNEPFTAITAIDRLGQALSRLASRRVPAAIRLDERGEARVVSEPRCFDSLLSVAFDTIAGQASSHPLVMARLIQTIDRLGRRVRRGDDRAALVRLLDRTWESIAQDPQTERDRRSLAQLHQKTKWRLEHPRLTPERTSGAARHSRAS